MAGIELAPPIQRVDFELLLKDLQLLFAVALPVFFLALEQLSLALLLAV
jgi:hypothetical protein